MGSIHMSRAQATGLTRLWQGGTGAGEAAPVDTYSLAKVHWRCVLAGSY